MRTGERVYIKPQCARDVYRAIVNEYVDKNTGALDMSGLSDAQKEAVTRWLGLYLCREDINRINDALIAEDIAVLALILRDRCKKFRLGIAGALEVILAVSRFMSTRNITSSVLMKS